MPLSGTTLIERRWLIFLLVALLLRGLYAEWRVAEVRPVDELGWWSFNTPDTHSYFDPIESLLKGGDYKPDYRMPGIGVPYFLFRQVMDPIASRDAMVVLQWLLSGIGVYLLALIALRISGSHTVALATYGIFLFSTFTSWHDTSLSTDSLAVSVLIIHMFLLQRSIDAQSRWILLAAGLMFTWFIFLRPVAFLLLGPAAFLLYLRWGGTRSLIPVGLFLLPFVLIDGVWAARNWRSNHELNLLTNEGIMPDDIATRTRGYLMRFVQGYGGDYNWWVPGADIRWYGEWSGIGEPDDEGRKADPPPDYAYVPGYTKDSLMAIGEQIRLIEGGSLSSADSMAAVVKVTSALDRYAELYKHGAPFNYHVLSRIRPIEYMVYQNGTETLFPQSFGALPLWKKLFKLFQMLIYFFGLILGAVASAVWLWNWRRTTDPLTIWVPLVTVYMVWIYPLGVRMGEWRYMVHVFPLALMLAICFAWSMAKRMRTRAQ
jgi:hypothetical protein